ncbi:MAG: transcriptional regulator NanR [Ancalomicrobiaceae bacterium]|nr:transcriptional regulator NanR [Ancalomicrobiaceae bacterium]
MKIDVSPIVRRKLSDEVTDRLKVLITSGQLQPGETLPSERELMQRYHVGRPAVREALQTLNSLGLIVTMRGERSRVCQVTAKTIFQQMDNAVHLMFATSPASLDHLKEARLFFERGMVRAAAETATEDHLAKLRAIVGSQRANLGNMDVFIAADTQFHAQIAAISGNPIYESVSGAMLTWLKAYHTDLLVWASRETRTLDEHEAILRQIERRDPDAAEREMVQHLTRTAAIYGVSSPT